MKLEEKLIRDTHALLADIALPGSTYGRTANDPFRGSAPSEPIDAHIEIALSEDLMTVQGTFYPPRGEAELITVEGVIDQLTGLGVVCGIDHDVIGQSVFSCNTDRSTLHAVELARGREPVLATIAHFELAEREAVAAPREVGGRIDHRSRTTLPMVEVGDVLAREVPAIAGIPGITVTGIEIPFRTIDAKTVTGGENTTTEGGEIRALIDGLWSVAGSAVSVSPTIVLREGVDYRTGNIDFNGDVVLHGRVGDGFTISCTGLLHAETTLDAFGITCGTLYAKQGMIGHNAEPVRVRETATTRFLQNTILEAGGTVRVRTSMLKAHVTAGEFIELGSDSTVIGSVLRAQLGAVVWNVGSPGAAVCEIYLAIDFQVDHRLAEIRDNTIAVTTRLRELQLTRQRAEHRVEDLIVLERSLTQALKILAHEAGELVTRLDRNENAELVVHGTLYAGTYVEICHRSFFVEQDMRRCRLRIDKIRGLVVAEYLESGSR